MEEWFTALTLFEKVYWITALAGSVVLLILMILTFVGGDIDDVSGDIDADIDGDGGIGFQFLSFKNLVGFFTIFGWSESLALKMDFQQALPLLFPWFVACL